MYFIILLFSLVAEAHLTSDVDMNIGYSSIDVNLGDAKYSTLNSTLALDFNYNLNVSSIDSLININFQETLQSNFGSLVHTRLGIGLQWYYNGLPGQRVILDNQVHGKIWRPSPFVGANIGLTNLSLESESKGGFNAAVGDVIMTFGFELPVAIDWFLLMKLNFIMSVMSQTPESSSSASDGSQLDDSLDINYSGVQIFAGLKILSF